MSQLTRDRCSDISDKQYEHIAFLLSQGFDGCDSGDDTPEYYFDRERGNTLDDITLNFNRDTLTGTVTYRKVVGDTLYAEVKRNFSPHTPIELYELNNLVPLITHETGLELLAALQALVYFDIVIEACDTRNYDLTGFRAIIERAKTGTTASGRAGSCLASSHSLFAT